MKKLSTIFAVLAILLSDVMCAVVAYNYCALEWGGKYEAWSAPASTALLLAIPYAIGPPPAKGWKARFPAMCLSVSFWQSYSKESICR